MTLTTLTTLTELAEKFDAFLIDQFGVLLDGSTAYEGAIDALSALTEMGKQTIILTNSGRRSHLTQDRLQSHGFSRSSYTHVISSGEVARKHLVHFQNSEGDVAKRIWYHADTLDSAPIEGLRFEVVEHPANADLLIIASVATAALTLGEYEEMLSSPAELGIPCLCTNPDHEQLTPTGKTFSAGVVAQLYSELGGPIEWIGKPFGSIYRAAMECLPDMEIGRIVCIGDSLAHDIQGGNQAGLATALVRTGIHADLSDKALATKCKEIGVSPDFYLEAFQWR